MPFGPAAQPLPGSASMQTDRLPSAGEPSSCSTVLAGVGESSAILMNFERTRASTSPSRYSISYEPSWLIRRTLPKYHRVRFSPSSEALKRAVTVHPIDSCFVTDPPCSPGAPLLANSVRAKRDSSPPSPFSIPEVSGELDHACCATASGWSGSRSGGG